MRKNPASYHLGTLGTLATRGSELAQSSKSPHVARIVAVANDTIPQMNGINNKLSRPDVTRTDAANFLDVSRAMKITLDGAFNGVRRAGTIANEAELEIGQREDARLGFKKGHPDRTAFVAKIATMPLPDVMKQIGVWMKDKEHGGSRIGVILEADPFLTGLPPETLGRLRSDFVKAWAPDLTDERDAIDRAVEIAVATHRAVKMVADEVSDERRYNEIIRQKAEADADDVAFRPNNAT
jgi:hypothetical protein